MVKPERLRMAFRATSLLLMAEVARAVLHCLVKDGMMKLTMMIGDWGRIGCWSANKLYPGSLSNDW